MSVHATDAKPPVHPRDQLLGGLNPQICQAVVWFAAADRRGRGFG